MAWVNLLSNQYVDAGDLTHSFTITELIAPYAVCAHAITISLISSGLVTRCPSVFFEV